MSFVFTVVAPQSVTYIHVPTVFLKHHTMRKFIAAETSTSINFTLKIAKFTSNQLCGTNIRERQKISVDFNPYKFNLKNYRISRRNR